MSNSSPGDGDACKLPAIEAMTGPIDTLPFLDVYLQREKDWAEALNRQSVFRLPTFKGCYDALEEAVLDLDDARVDDADDFARHFLKAAKKASRDLHAFANVNAKKRSREWPEESSFGAGQLTHALNAEGMRLDKAVVIVFAFNRVAKEFRLCGHHQMGCHSIVCCGFYFDNLYRRIERFGGAKVNDDAAFNKGVAEIARLANQPEDIIRGLAGLRVDTELPEFTQDAVTHFGSYATLFAILMALATRLPEAKAALENNPAIEKMIVRRRPKMQVPKIFRDEAIVARAVTTGPYAWPREGDAEVTEWPVPPS